MFSLTQSQQLAQRPCLSFKNVQTLQYQLKIQNQVVRVNNQQRQNYQGTSSVQEKQGETKEINKSVQNEDSETKEEAQFDPNVDIPEEDLIYYQQSQGQQLFTRFKLIFALPWKRFKKGAFLNIRIGGELSEYNQGPFGNGMSLPQICNNLEKATYDPRVLGVIFTIKPLATSWAVLYEIRNYINLFKQSGKHSFAYILLGGEKEFYLASAFNKVYITKTTGTFSLLGFQAQGQFLRGVLDKIGIDPQVKRIGKFKSAGDQLLRKDMSEFQRVQLSELVDDVHNNFVQEIAKDRNKTPQQVEELLDSGEIKPDKFVENGWVDGARYEDQVRDELKKIQGRKQSQGVRFISQKKYARVRTSTFGLTGKTKIAIIRTQGAIFGVGGGGVTSDGIQADDVIKQIRFAARNKSVAGIILRIDSPGGDAIASDFLWREIKIAGELKPMIASMGSVAASGGYYMSMAAQKILADPLTITGSIGIVGAKFNLQKLYEKIGFSKEVVSIGKYAELLTDYRGFNQEEESKFNNQIEILYEDFRNKAAASRGKTPEDMETFAQGRVWSGTRALQNGLIDGVGGLSKAIATAKRMLKLQNSDRVTLLELSRKKISPLKLLTQGASLSQGENLQNIPVFRYTAELIIEAVQSFMLQNGSTSSVSGKFQEVAKMAIQQLSGLNTKQNMQFKMDDIEVNGISSQNLMNLYDTQNANVQQSIFQQLTKQNDEDDTLF